MRVFTRHSLAKKAARLVTTSVLSATNLFRLAQAASFGLASLLCLVNIIAMQPVSAQTAPLTQMDQAFLLNAWQANLAEIVMAKLAKTKSTDLEVKKFAQQMETDHLKLHQELKQLALNKGVEVSRKLDEAGRNKVLELNRASEKKFETQYIHEFGVKAHLEAVQLFRKISIEARDPELKTLAAYTLPTLQEHLKKAYALAVRLNAQPK